MPAQEVETIKKQASSALTKVRAELKSAYDQVRSLEDEERRLIGALDSLGESVVATASHAGQTIAKRTPRKRRRKQATAGAREAELLEILGTGEYSRADLAERMKLSKVRIQQLLKPLNEQKLVVSRRDPNSTRPLMLWSAKSSTASAAGGNGKGAKAGRAKAKPKPKAKAKA